MRNMYLSKIVSVARQMKVYVDFSSNGVELEFRRDLNIPRSVPIRGNLLLIGFSDILRERNTGIGT